VPELPEVETVVRDLRPMLVGRSFGSVQVGKKPLRRRWNRQWTSKLAGCRVAAIRRRGKWLHLVLGADHHLVIHLGMTGQLGVFPADEPIAPHTHIVIGLDEGRRQLRFRDVRRFGSATVFANRQEVEQFFVASGLGPEPFDLDLASWRARLGAARRCIKAVLLDQRVIAGVGNIYADEALFEARIHPGRLACGLDPAETAILARAIVTVLDRAIRKRGSSIRDYRDGSGRKGKYQAEFRVYQRTGQPCFRCAWPIEQMRLAGRSTHYCPRCQKKKR
jgi:formamidopyrimidine-DNA glycosylase